MQPVLDLITDQNPKDHEASVPLRPELPFLPSLVPLLLWRPPLPGCLILSSFVSLTFLLSFWHSLFTCDTLNSFQIYALYKRKNVLACRVVISVSPSDFSSVEYNCWCHQGQPKFEDFLGPFIAVNSCPCGCDLL